MEVTDGESFTLKTFTPKPGLVQIEMISLEMDEIICVDVFAQPILMG
jgi:hypothetical protein